MNHARFGNWNIFHRALDPLHFIALLGLLAFAGCQDATGPDFDPDNLLIVRTSGDSQSGLLGEALPDSMVIWVQDELGQPIVGLPIAWEPLTAGSIVGAAQSITDAEGRAATVWTLAPTFGRQELVVKAVLPGGSTLLQTLYAESFPLPARIVIEPGGYAFEVGEEVDFTATVFDHAGEEVPDYPIVWDIRPIAAGIVHDPPVATIDQTGRVAALRAVDGVLITVDALGAQSAVTVPIYNFAVGFFNGDWEPLTGLELNSHQEVWIRTRVTEELGRSGPFSPEVLALDPTIVEIRGCMCGGSTAAFTRVLRPLESGETVLIARTKMAADTIPVTVMLE
ncbi:MAG: Ig-like domain-containing protein [Gemmatimonadota bacterium]